MTEEKEANENQDSNRLQVENENAKNNGNQRFVYAFFRVNVHHTQRIKQKKNHSFCSLVSKMYYNWVFVGVFLSEKNNFDMKAEIKDV